MTHEEVIQKLSSGFCQDNPDFIRDAVYRVPEKVLCLPNDIEISQSTRKRDTGEAIPGEYEEDLKKIKLYGPHFEPRVFFHELGHCIYREVEEVREKVKELFQRSPLYEFCMEEFTQDELDDKSSEYMADGYEAFKTNKVIPGKFDDLIGFLEENDL